MYPPWLNRDATLIILARGIRTFAQSFVAVLIALYLAALGFSLIQVGVFLSVGVVGVAFFAFLVGLVAGRVGRRPLLVFFSMTSALAGLGLVFVDHYLILLVFAFLGSLSAGGGGGGESPAQPLEVASLPDTAPNDKRTDLFAYYNIVARAGGALGALAVKIMLANSIAWIRTHSCGSEAPIRCIRLKSGIRDSVRSSMPWTWSILGSDA